MSTVVVDASVAVAWVVPESGQDACATLRNDPYILLAPEFMLVEFSNALWKKAERGEFDPAFIDGALADMREFDIAWSEDADLLPYALRLAITHHHPVYDCLYLALSQREGAALATMDRKLVSLAKRLDSPVAVWEALLR